MNNYHYKYLKYKSKYIDLKKFIQHGSANNQFAHTNNILCMSIFNNLEGASKIFSPIGITFTMGLIYLATTASANQELYDLFNYRYNLPELNNIYHLFNNDIITLTTVFIINNQTLKGDYLDNVGELVLFFNEDFNNGESIKQKINNRLETITDGMLKNTILDKEIDTNVVFIIVNTITLRIKWLYEFDVNNTIRMMFQKTNMVDMMHQLNKFHYYENELLQFIEIPFSDTDYTMGIILPIYKEENNLINTPYNIPKFTVADINNLIAKMEYNIVDLYLPKFHHNKNIKLAPILQKIGINKIFDKAGSPLNIISKNIHINEIIHEVIITVNEVGITTAPKTIIDAQQRPGPEKIFKADHVFIYYIRHLPTNIILFFGDYQGN